MLKQTLANLYLDKYNNYLTITLFAEHQQITEAQASLLLELGKQFHEELVKDYQQNIRKPQSREQH